MARKRLNFIIVRLNLENRAFFNEKKAIDSTPYQQWVNEVNGWFYWALRSILPFRYLIEGNCALATALMTTYFKVSFCNMLCSSPLNPSAPHAPWFRLHLIAHECNGFSFWNTKLGSNSIKRCSVFPSHFDYTIYFSFGKFFHYGRTFQCVQSFYSLCIRNNTCPKKFAPRAEDRSHGAKNGSEIGKT